MLNMEKGIALYTITSDLHASVAAADVLQESFIRDIEAELGESFIFKGQDFSSYGCYERSLIYVRTGGTEGIFKALVMPVVQEGQTPWGQILLLTSGKNNSLAASMEILSYLNQQGLRGEILHGSAKYIAGRIKSGCDVQNGQLHTSDAVIRTCGVQNAFFLEGIAATRVAAGGRYGGGTPVENCQADRLGIVGRPSDWLISSDVDYAKARENFGLELVDIPIEELIDAVKAMNVSDLHSFSGSEAIYEALKGIVAKYSLSGLTLRCFDLLDALHNTGCLALARLNAEGIPSSCEGDIPALISMVIAQRLTGVPGFQCNLSKVDGDEYLFAHCTVPLNMVTSYRYDTHFESGIGTAIKGELPLGPATVFKVAPDLEHYVAIPAEIVRNQSEPGLCRTQIVVRIPGGSSYFLNSPLANHHVIVPGNILSSRNVKGTSALPSKA